MAGPLPDQTWLCRAASEDHREKPGSCAGLFLRAVMGVRRPQRIRACRAEKEGLREGASVIEKSRVC
jgi:hypothetical protein